MKQPTEFRVRPHSVTPDAEVVEVWVRGTFVATITASDAANAGIRVTSKYLYGAKVVNEGPRIAHTPQPPSAEVEFVGVP